MAIPEELLQLLLLFGLGSLVCPGPQRRRVYLADDYPSSRSCSLADYAATAQCMQTDYRLTCTYGFTTHWTKGVKHEITYLRVVQWPGDCLNVGRLQQRFPSLSVLEIINCTQLNVFKGHFDGTSNIEKIVMYGLPELWEIPADMVATMPLLAEMDLRGNGLRHMRPRLLRSPPRLRAVYLKDNQWDCSDEGLDWLAMESDNGSVKKKILDYTKLVCHQKLYRGKPLPLVMNVIKRVRQTCPEPCKCVMTHVVSDGASAVIPIITVDCAGRGLSDPPATLPPNTTTLRLEGNKITTIRSIVQNPQYKRLHDLYLDNNSISAVKELEGTEFFTSLRVLSLRGNNLRQIPVYAFDKALQGNNNIMNLYLGRNPWRCDCHFIPRFQALILKYRRVIKDLVDIKCHKTNDQATSLAQISSMPLGNVCKSEAEMPISIINIVNLSLTAALLLVIGRFLYDWHSFKTTGKLPWISSILP